MPPKSLIEILRDNHEATHLAPQASFYDQYQASAPDARNTNRVPGVYTDPTLQFSAVGGDADEENRRRKGIAALPLSGVSGDAAAQMVLDATRPPATVPAVPPSVPSVPSVAGPAAQSTGATVPPPTVPEVPPSTVPGGSPRIFPTSAGLPGGYNMGNDPRFVPTDAQGVPIGQQMVPVRGLSGGTASVGMNPDVGPLPSSVPMRSETGIMPPTIGQAPDFGAAAVLRATPQETATLDRWRTQGRTLEQQDSITARLKEFERGQQAANAAATRQIAVAQGTPQVAAGGAGNVAWDPNANDGRGGVVSDVRLPNEARGAQPPDPQSVRIKQIKDLTSAYRAMIPHLDPMTELQMQAELSKEPDPAKKRAIRQRFGIGEQSDQALAVLAQIAQLTASAAPASAAPAAPAAPTAVPATGTPPPAGSVAAKYLRK